MSKQDDELFRAWWPTGDGSPEAAFAAGREAGKQEERERVLGILDDARKYGGIYDRTWGTLMRRIKEQEK